MKRVAIISVYRFFLITVTAVGFISCVVQKTGQLVRREEVGRIVQTLSSDAMQGRAAFTPGAEKAASFIESEFKKIGLKALSTEKGYRQPFFMNRVIPQSVKAVIGGDLIDPEDVLVISDQASVQWNNNSDVEVLSITAGESFFARYRQIVASGKHSLVFVDEALRDAFNRLQAHVVKGRVVEDLEGGAAVFVLGHEENKSFQVNFLNRIEEMPLFNVVAMIPGKSKPQEYVIFSGHYDHIGIIEPVDGDSIANGADDDASGVTAVLALAKYYKKLNNNERTLIFVAFTAEEMGGFGSRYFSRKLSPEAVVAMFNIEMIGKVSKFGNNSAFITGYEKSDFGEILQRNLEGTEFKFYPDPYPQENLFYRSDNATLAARGVPAHTISTVQIDTDKNYHTVNDEMETLDLDNITATIKAIAISSRSIISGQDSPRRIPKLNQQE